MNTEETAVVDPVWIKAHLDDPAVRIIEIDVSPVNYQSGHIPGAVLWNAYSDLRDGSYAPVGAVELAALLSKSGITPESTVVCYGYGASLGFWLMKAYGHADVRMLPGPRDQWIDAGAAWVTDVPASAETLYPTPIADLSLIASQEDVEAAISNPECTILDVRSDLEYTGQRFWPSGAPQDNGRSGHVPGAVNVPIDLLLGEDGKLKNVEALSAEFEKAAVDANKKIITYCTIGNRASNAWWGLTHLLGFPNVSVYYGSWSEWGTSPDTPIES